MQASDADLNHFPPKKGNRQQKLIQSGRCSYDFFKARRCSIGNFIKSHLKRQNCFSEKKPFTFNRKKPMEISNLNFRISIVLFCSSRYSWEFCCWLSGKGSWHGWLVERLLASKPINFSTPLGVAGVSLWYWHRCKYLLMWLCYLHTPAQNPIDS